LSRDAFYTAIDIGTGKIASIVARVGSEGELKILGSGVVPSQGVQKGRIESIDEVQTAIRASLDESQKYIARGVIDGVYVSVSGTHLSCLNTKEAIDNPEDVSDVNTQLLHRLIRSSFPRVGRSQEILHVIPIAYDVDGLSGVRNPIGLHAEQVQVEAHVVLGDAATLRNTIKAVEACKVTVKSLVLQSLASAEATLTGDEREIGAVLADIGSGTTDVIIYRQGSPWFSAVIPVGGNQLTRDLSVALRTSFHLAEEIKVKWGHALPELVREDEEVVIPSFQGQPRRVVRRRDLGEPLQARFEELLKLIVLKVRQAGLRQIPAGGLIITGGCAEMPGVRELAQKVLGGPVRIAYPRGIAGLPTQLKKPAFSASVGLLLWGIKHLGEKRPYLNGERTLRDHKPLMWRFKRLPEAIRKVKVG
jgi:cell division protein FtsA